MRKSSIILFSVAVLLSAGAWKARTQNQQAAASLTIEKVKDNLYAIIGDGGNVAVYVTSEGVILIDDKYERDYTDIMAKVKGVTDKPVRYVLNTHQHGDHTGGNEKMLASSVEIIAHRNARANMVTGKLPGVPRISFSDETSVFLGGKEVRAHYFGRGHTNGDVVIYFPDAKVIHTGDLLTNSPPFVDYSGKGSLAEWSTTLDNVNKAGWDFDTVIPGHGPVTKQANLTEARDKAAKIRDRVSGMVRDGKSKDDITKALIAEFGYAAGGIQIGAVGGMMEELKK